VSLTPITYEAYLIIRPLHRLAYPYTSVGKESLLDKIGYPQYGELKHGSIIDISPYIAENGITAWHQQIDESSFTNFESSDYSIRLSAIKSDDRRRRPFEDGHFYNKLSANELWWIFEQIKDRSAIERLNEYVVSAYSPELNLGFFGILDPKQLRLNEGNGEIDMTIYSALKKLEKFPAATITDSYMYDDEYWRSWYFGETVDDAFARLWDRFNSPEFVDPDYRPGHMVDYTQYTLSFVNRTESFDGVADDAQINDLSWDGTNLWLATRLGSGGSQNYYRPSIDSGAWAESDDMGPNGRPYFPWEPQLSLDVLPGAGNLVCPNYGSGGGTLPLARGGYYRYADYTYYYFLVSTYSSGVNTVAIKKYTYTGRTGGITQWSDVVAAMFETGTDYEIGPGTVSNLVVINSSLLYLTFGNRFWKWTAADGTSPSEADLQIDVLPDDEEFELGLTYLANNGLLICPIRDTNNRDCIGLQIRQSSDGDLIGSRSGDIPTENDFDKFDLVYEDILLDTVFEIRIYHNDEPINAICGCARTWERGEIPSIKFFLLDENFEKCIYYTSLSDGLDNRLYSHTQRISLTRGTFDETITEYYGGVPYDVTYTFNEVIGFVGGGSPAQGIIFKFSKGHTENIRVLNLQDLTAAQSMAELAKFTNSYFYIEDVPEFGVRTVMRPRLCLVGRDRYSESAENWQLDPQWISWQKQALYSQYGETIEVDFAGGTTKVGAELPSIPGVGVVPFSKIYGAESQRLTLKFVYDLHYAQYRANESLNFVFHQRQLWTIETPLLYNSEGRTFKLLDTVELRIRTHGWAKAIIIAIDIHPNSRTATLKCITINDQTDYRVNPFLSSVGAQQLTQIEPVN